MGQLAVDFSVRHRRAARSSRRGRAVSIGVAALFAVGATIAASSPAVGLRESSLLRSSPFSAIRARASHHAFGWSGRVNMRVALPNEKVNYPIEISGALDSISWHW